VGARVPSRLLAPEGGARGLGEVDREVLGRGGIATIPSDHPIRERQPMGGDAGGRGRVRQDRVRPRDPPTVDGQILAVGDSVPGRERTIDRNSRQSSEGYASPIGSDR
jgi:hypothetical protein